MENLNVAELWDKGIALAVEFAPKLLLAILTLIIGLWIIGRVTNLVKKGLAMRDTDPALQTFVSSLINMVLKVMLFISVASMFGIETTSFVALLGAAGLAIGLALQGSLGNFAGGVLILLFRPFKVGDLIEAQGHFGSVKAINLFVTSLSSPENKTILIPNGPLSNGIITNFTKLGQLRVDLVIGISYDANIQQARDVIMQVMESDEKVLKNPAPSVSVLELADSSVNLAVRPFATPADYWDVYFGITEKAKIALDGAGIEIPFPQVVEYHKSL